MAWTVEKTWKDLETGLMVEKQCAPKSSKTSYSDRVRYRIIDQRGQWFMTGKQGLLDLSDTIADVADAVEDGEF